jgi:hypothetical protein
MDLQELRERRLAALEGRAGSGGGGGGGSREQASSSPLEDQERPPHPPQPAARPLSSEEVKTISRIVWPSSSTEDDRDRWLSQGFTLCAMGSGGPACGLKQSAGGPCGVLAAIQAEIIRMLVFDGGSGAGLGKLPEPSLEEATEAMVGGMATVLARAGKEDGAESPGRIVVVSAAAVGEQQQQQQSLEGVASTWVRRVCLSEESAREELHKALPGLMGPLGVMIFVSSLILTRGADAITKDMDDAGYLTGQFGHCTQELINLLLCGRAVSNVFDGKVPLGDTGLMVGGIPCRQGVGYLSHLESLRYLSVGTYYKSPKEPVWVIGSTSHFTVLFGVDRNAVTESESQLMLDRARRAFKAVDSAEAGFIPVDKLKDAISDLLPEMASEPSGAGLSALANHIQMPGAGIIVWSDFWCNVSRLMTGVSLQSVIAGKSDEAGHSSGRQRSDSEVARELQQQFNSQDNSNIVQGSAGGSDGGSRPRSDSDLARELQAQFDAGDAGASIASAPTSAPSDPAPATPRVRSHIHRHDSIADPDEPAVELYHYNGMSKKHSSACATLVRAEMRRRATENAIGEAVALDVASGGGMSYMSPIDEVLRTRWPGCRIEWSGTPPSLD